MIKPRRPLPSRLIPRRLRPLPVARGLRRHAPADTRDWQPVGIRWRRVAAPRSAGAAGGRMAARSLAAAGAPVPARRAPPAYPRIAPRVGAVTLPSRAPGSASPLQAPGVTGDRGATGQQGRPGAPGAAPRIGHHWQRHSIVRATMSPIAAPLPPSARAPGDKRPGPPPLPATPARHPDRQLRALPERIDAGSAKATARAISPAWRSTAARRAIHATAPAPAITGWRPPRPTAKFGPYNAAPGGEAGIGWSAPRRARPSAAALAMRAELVWRDPAPGSHTVAGADAVDRPSRDAPVTPAKPAAPPVATTTAPSRAAAHPVQLDAATTERLVEDVLRRAEQRLRIERERRGL